MSWSGPVAGTPYQPPPYVHGQPAFGQPQPYQYGQQPGHNQHQPVLPQSSVPTRPPDNRPPKKKGNPIITKYPPPPGYRGPAQPQGPYGATQYPGQYQQYPQAPPVPSAYPNQAYQAPPTPQGYSPQNYGPPQNYSPPPSQPHPQPSAFPQSGYQPAPNYQWPQQPQQVFPQQPGFSQPPNYPNSQGYAPSQSTYSGYPTLPTPVEQNQQNWSQAQTWQQPSASAPYPPTAHFNSFGAPPVNGQQNPDHNALPTPISAHTATSHNIPVSALPLSATSEIAPGEKGPLNLALYDWDFDFEGAIWPKAHEPVDPDFSLGQILWHPAKQVTRALPSTFAEAQEQADNPPAEKLGNGESVSIYFTPENSHEAFLDVRQTDEWYKIQDDPVFVVFTDEIMAKFIPVEECIALRDRPDEPLEETKQEEDKEMRDSNWDVMDDLEQALSSTAEDQKAPPLRQDAAPSRDQTQEDILAKLGVTGHPKTPSGEVMSVPFSFKAKPPASLPPKPPAPPATNIPSRPEHSPHRAHSYGGHRNSTYGLPAQRPYGSFSSSRPLPHDARNCESRSLKNPQNQRNGQTLDGARESPARSEGSNRTMAGSDFETEPINGTEQTAGPVPQLKRSDSSFARKRSYEDTDHDDQKTRQHDDHAKRKRRSQVASAYSRR